MRGLSTEIESAINTILEGLDYEINLDQSIRNYDTFPEFIGNEFIVKTNQGKKYSGILDKCTDETITLKYKNGRTQRIYHNSIKEAIGVDAETDIIEADKMKSIIDAKTSSFNLAKQMLHKWVNSQNAPGDAKLKEYVNRIVASGEKAVDFFREALSQSIDYSGLEFTKFSAAIKAKPLILSGIFELESSITELKIQLESDTVNLSEKEFKIGYPERFAKGEFFPKENYWKDWYEERYKGVNICPFSTKGKLVTLQELKIRLPEPPKDKSKILFSDKKKEDQYWRRLPVPSNITPDNQDAFSDYILEEFRRRREGIWFMNNGEPVYLTGNHYFALQWCKMMDDGGYMSFRYAQLNMFYHLEACIIDNRCLGQIFLKSRRTGFTYIVLSILMNMSTGSMNSKYGMTSKSGDDAEEAWAKFSYMYQSLPFFLRPVVKGKEDSTRELFFGKPSDNSKETKKARELSIDDYLNTMVDYRPTKNDSYDSVKLNGYLGDECGKWTKPNDYIKHLGMISPTMLPAGRVVGKAFIGSTMGSHDKGGEQFIELINGSRVEDRNPTTEKTSTALYYYFLPAQDNMEEFTDKYGKCWTEKPLKRTLNVLGQPIKMGSVDYLMAVEEQKKQQSDSALNEQYRTYPRTEEHALRDTSVSSVFNLNKLYEQLEYNESIPEESRYSIGNFNWVNGIKDGDVEFNPNPQGRFKIAWIPSKVDGTEFLQNRVKNINGKFFPLNGDVLRFGCDPFTLRSTHGEGSKGGLHGLTLKFPEYGAPSNKFVVQYLSRPPDEIIFFEDVIKCIKFYGAPILVESNRIDLLRHMKNRGYRGFAMDRMDRPVSKLNDNEKFYGGQMMSGQDIIESHLNSVGAWIENYVGKSTKEQIRPLDEMGDFVFNETIKDWISFNPDKRTKHDAFISSGLAIMACNKEKYKGKPKKKDSKKYASLIKVYENSGDISTPINRRLKIG